MKLIDKSLSTRVLMVGVTCRADKPNGGGVSSVVATYNQYIDGLRYIPTWKQTNKFGKAIFFFWNYLWLLLLLCFDWRIRIVHIHAASDASFERKMLVFRLARFFGKRTILHMHAGEFDRYYKGSSRKRQIKSVILNCDKLIALSSSWRDYYVSFGKKENDVLLLNNIVESPRKSKNYSKDVHLLFLGWLGDKKGVFDLLDVIVEHKEYLSGKLQLRLGGFDNYDRIQTIIDDNGIQDIVTLEGWVSGDKKEECLNWANVFILPSYYEGLPISILEAMSYGMPVISTTVGGIPEIVKNGENGFTVTPGNKEQIWDAIRFFLRHPEEIENYGKKSLELVKPYTPECVLKDLRNIYLDLLRK